MFQGLFQPMHLLVILVIALIIWGPGKLPELGSALGKGIKDFKKALSEQETKASEMSSEDQKTITKETGQS